MITFWPTVGERRPASPEAASGSPSPPSGSSTEAVGPISHRSPGRISSGVVEVRYPV